MKLLLKRLVFGLSLVLTTAANAQYNTWYDYSSMNGNQGASQPYLAIRGYKTSLDVGRMQGEIGNSPVDHHWVIYQQDSDGVDGSGPVLISGIPAEIAEDDLGDLDNDATEDISATDPSATDLVDILVTDEVDWGDSAFLSPSSNSHDYAAFSIAFGAKFSSNVRAELELVKTGRVSFASAMFADQTATLEFANGADHDGTDPATTDPYTYDVDYSAGINYNAFFETELYMINLLYDIDLGIISPFFGIGIGFSQNTTIININSTGGEDGEGAKIFDGFYDQVEETFTTSAYKTENFVYSLILGFSKPITKNSTMEVGYKFTDLGKAKWALYSESDVDEGEVPDIKTRSIMQSADNVTASEIFMGIRMGF